MFIKAPFPHGPQDPQPKVDYKGKIVWLILRLLESCFRFYIICFFKTNLHKGRPRVLVFEIDCILYSFNLGPTNPTDSRSLYTLDGARHDFILPLAPNPHQDIWRHSDDQSPMRALQAGHEPYVWTINPWQMNVGFRSTCELWEEMFLLPERTFQQKEASVLILKLQANESLYDALEHYPVTYLFTCQFDLKLAFKSITWRKVSCNKLAHKFDQVHTFKSPNHPRTRVSLLWVFTKFTHPSFSKRYVRFHILDMISARWWVSSWDHKIHADILDLDISKSNVGLPIKTSPTVCYPGNCHGFFGFSRCSCMFVQAAKSSSSSWKTCVIGVAFFWCDVVQACNTPKCTMCNFTSRFRCSVQGLATPLKFSTCYLLATRTCLWTWQQSQIFGSWDVGYVENLWLHASPLNLHGIKLTVYVLEGSPCIVSMFLSSPFTAFSLGIFLWPVMFCLFYTLLAKDNYNEIYSYKMTLALSLSLKIEDKKCIISFVSWCIVEASGGNFVGGSSLCAQFWAGWIVLTDSTDINSL